jgi:bacterioferritin-associated ferredoxin
MIVCSCNVFSESEVRHALASAVRPPRISQVYTCLGYAAQCGRCARTIKKIMDEASAMALRHAMRAEMSAAQLQEYLLEGKPAYRAAVLDPVQTG